MCRRGSRPPGSGSGSATPVVSGESVDAACAFFGPLALDGFHRVESEPQRLEQGARRPVRRFRRRHNTIATTEEVKRLIDKNSQHRPPKTATAILREPDGIVDSDRIIYPDLAEPRRMVSVPVSLDQPDITRAFGGDEHQSVFCAVNRRAVIVFELVLAALRSPPPQPRSISSPPRKHRIIRPSQRPQRHHANINRPDTTPRFARTHNPESSSPKTPDPRSGMVFCLETQQIAGPDVCLGLLPTLGSLHSRLASSRSRSGIVYRRQSLATRPRCISANPRGLLIPTSIELVQWSRGFAFGSIGGCCSCSRGLWCCVARIRGGRPRIVPQYITNTATLLDDDRTILLVAGPCRSRRQTTVVESLTEVRVGVTALIGPGSIPGCEDHVRIELDSVLGSRSLIDSRNGRVVEVERAR